MGSRIVLAERRTRLAPQGGRLILILDTDLFHSIGGGQSVYARIIQGRPGDHFCYFRAVEAADALRPANTTAIPLLSAYVGHGVGLAADLEGFLHDYVTCRNFAASVAATLPGQRIDVVDVPDYRPLGAFIRSAFQAEGIPVGMVALALHGTLSAAFKSNWPTGGDDRRVLASLRAREHLQFRAAEHRYAISAEYAETWRRYADMPVHLLDPLCVAGIPGRATPPLGGAAPDLAFIGRREKWKGPDLFLDLAWCLDRADYGRLILAGPDGPNRLGQSSEGPLATVAQHRDLEPEMPGGLDRAAIERLFAGRTLLLLPSRHDTFNLTVLEATLAGCPVIVSRHAGVARWLRERLPDLDWMTVDLDCSRVAAGTVTAVLRDYDLHRAQLAETLGRMSLAPDATSLAGVYCGAPASDPRAMQVGVELSDLMAASTLRLEDGRIAGQQRGMGWRTALFPARGVLRTGKRLVLTDPILRTWKRLPRPVRATVHAVRESAGVAYRAARQGDLRGAGWQTLAILLQRQAGLSDRNFAQLKRLREQEALRSHARKAPERTRRELTDKLAHLAGAVGTQHIDRVPLFRTMARLERKRGNDLIAATYLLRTLRWMGEDRRGDLPFVVATLAAHGFPREAEVARAMFAPMPEAERERRCLDLMRGAYEANRSKPDLPLAIVDDRRGAAQPRVAVIASLYNAADKLPTLLSMLARQSITQGAQNQGALEIVLVDSNSPSDERGAFQAFAAANPELPIVFARSAKRETIQAAWNRGIKLSRAPYLSFLGADEGLQPDALRQLAAVLDYDSRVDWAMANSLVTSVDRGGIYESDVMPYDRHGYRQDLVYLETCYLSWVGGLYRRSIHDRFGYYDESYRAAGDTEFKNRIMPHISSVHVPRMLGVFNNYPEERTTQHPRAEIEDLRAWYLWRSAAGMRYAFALRPAEDVLALLRDCAGYRKSFCRHLSTDFDLADALGRYLLTRPDLPPGAEAAARAGIEGLASLRALDCLPIEAKADRHGIARIRAGYRRLTAFLGLATRHRAAFGLDAPPPYEAFNDNRFEQHWWAWRAVP